MKYQDIRVFYPSGNVFVIKGKWEGPTRVGDESSIAVHQKNTVLFFDPRGVFVSVHGGAVLYNPRTQVQITPWVIDRLKEHPEWPEVAEIPGTDTPKAVFTGQADGGLLSGSRVEKIDSEPRDAHKNGAQGTVLGSQALPSGGIVYSVEWDDLPGTPIAIIGRLRKIKDE